MSTWEDHLQHVRQVLLRLRTNNLTAKPGKCQFGMKECSYLGHVVGNGQVKPDPCRETTSCTRFSSTRNEEARDWPVITGSLLVTTQILPHLFTNLTKKRLRTRKGSLDWRVWTGIWCSEGNTVWSTSFGKSWLYQAICFTNGCIQPRGRSSVEPVEWWGERSASGIL